MKKLLLWLLLPNLALAQFHDVIETNHTTKPSSNCIDPSVQLIVNNTITQNIKRLRAASRIATIQDAGTVLFEWPLKQRPPLDYTYFGLSFFVDHDASQGNVLDYNGGSRTYDGHTGTDISPQPYQWDMMDNSRVEVIAAASGTIVYKTDGNYDRRCDANYSYIANAIVLQHSDGSQTWYWHLKNGSLTSKEVGAVVQVGEYLGTIGSSGISGGPHLHFEVRSPSNQVIDPFAGTSNPDITSSRWSNQKAYWDSQIGRLMTHTNLPNPYPSCTNNPSDITYEKRSFTSGEQVYFAKYGRDWQPGQVFNLKVIQPNGTVWANYSYTRPIDWQSYASNYNYFQQALPNPAPSGTWKFQVITLGNTYETVFNVNTTKPYANTTELCQSTTAELVAMNGGQSYSYQWQRNNVNITGATSERFTPTQAGNYTVIATINAISSTSDPITITANNCVCAVNTSISSGNWNNNATWSCGHVPTSTEPVQISSGHSIILDVNAVAKSLTLLGTLQQQNRTLTLQGN